MSVRFNSYYKSSDLSIITDLESQVPSLLLRDAGLQERVTRLVQDQPIRQYLEHPFRSHDQTELHQASWRALSPCVLYHNSLGDWVIKTNYGDGESGKFVGELIWRGDDMVAEFPAGRFDNLQRPLASQILRRGAQAVGLDLAVPEEYLVPIPNPQGCDLRQRFFVLSQRFNLPLDCLSGWERYYDRPDELRNLVRKICNYIIVTGKGDADVTNLRFSQEGQLVDVDSETVGLLKDVQELSAKEKADLAPIPTIIRIQGYAEAGLERFKTSFNDKIRQSDSNRSRLSFISGIIHDEVEQAKRANDDWFRDLPARGLPEETFKAVHVEANAQYNWCLIIASILMPLIPLILLIESAILEWRTTPQAISAT